MNRFWNRKTRLLSLLLSLVLAVGLIQTNAVTASAETTYSFSYAYDCQRDPAFPKKNGSLRAYSITLPKKGPTFSAGEYASSNANWVLTSLGAGAAPSGAGTYFNNIIQSVASEYHINTSQVEIFQLTKDGSHVAYGAILARSSAVTVFVGDNWTENGAGCGYLLSTSEITGDSLTVDIKEDATTLVDPNPSHTHKWTPVTTGNGTKAAATTISCSGCSETLSVSLTASDVTLPGSVFTAKISTEAASAARAAQSSLSVSQTPGYKYSASGSDFAPIDPNQFTPVPGFYQASILVTDGNDTVENLYVTYTASDPVVTAATGDNRPIERMVMGMAFFSALGIAAFFLDSKRKARR